MAAAPQRITMVNKYYPPHIGGVEFHVRDIAEGLVEHAGLQVRAIVCNGENARLEETVNGVDVVRLPRAFERASTPVSWGFTRELRAEARRDPGRPTSSTSTSRIRGASWRGSARAPTCRWSSATTATSFARSARSPRTGRSSSASWTAPTSSWRPRPT